MLEDGEILPLADRLLKDTSQSVRRLMQIDSKRLGRMLSFGHALAQVAVADNVVTEEERSVIAELVGRIKQA